MAIMKKFYIYRGSSIKSNMQGFEGIWPAPDSRKLIYDLAKVEPYRVMTHNMARTIAKILNLQRAYIVDVQYLDSLDYCYRCWPSGLIQADFKFIQQLRQAILIE